MLIMVPEMMLAAGLTLLGIGVYRAITYRPLPEPEPVIPWSPMDPKLAAELLRPAAEWVADAEARAVVEWELEYGFVPTPDGPRT
jgi:hypothetical protein